MLRVLLLLSLLARSPRLVGNFDSTPRRAINKSITVCEILKRRVVGLHQLAEIGSIDFRDVWEPLEAGLNRLETTRHVSVVGALLSACAGTS